MKHYTILRVEWKGLGMYESGLWREATQFNHMSGGEAYDTEIHPNPFEDEKIKQRFASYWEFDDTFYCAYLNKSQFIQWVFRPEWRTKMHELGADIVRYRVPEDHIVIGDKQVLFRKHESEVIDTIKVNCFD